MIRDLSAYLFGVHFLFPDQYVWVALAFVNAALMAFLAIRRRRSSMFSLYMTASALSSLFRASPPWQTPYDFVLVACACGYGWSLLQKGASKWFARSVGILLIGVLLISSPMDWPGYSVSRYHARLYTYVLLLGASVACVGERWASGERQNWRALIPAVWFATLFLTMVAWRTDTETREYWAWYWHIALAGKVAACACLLGWTRESFRGSPEVDA
jgi:hypothetical protein